MGVFPLVYTLVGILLFLAAWPFLLLLSMRPKYRVSIPARFFLWRNSPHRSGGVWFHVCSFGEARALRPLVERFAPERRRISVTTQTGFEAAQEFVPDQTRYLPFEPWLWLWMRPQKALVVMEAELWYLLFTLARKKGAKTFLINARISDRSWPSYRRFRWFYRRIFAQIDRVYAQSERDRERLELLGASSVLVTGNLKLSSVAAPSNAIAKPEGYLVCAGSTHEGEESAILEGFRALKAFHPDAKMVMVPRHPERFEKIERMMRGFARLQGWSFGRFSQENSLERDLTLMDRMGALIDCYAVSDLAIVGGAFEPIGGHNAAEAAQFGIPVISGPHFFNQRELFEGIEGMTIVEKDRLAETMRYPSLLTPARLRYRSDALELIEKEIRDVL